MSENGQPGNKIGDDRKDRRHFTITPRLVSALTRSPYEYTLWGIVKEIAGEVGECFLSTQDLATLSMMSTGQASKARKRLIAEGLLEGELRRDPGYPQPVWHLRIPDLWRFNVKWVEAHPKLKDRVAFKEAQKAEHKSIHQVKALSGEGGTSSGERRLSPGETKKNHTKKEKEEESGASSSLFQELRKICPSGKITMGLEEKLTKAEITPEKVSLYRTDPQGLTKFREAHPGNHPWLWPKQLYDELKAFESDAEKADRQQREFISQFKVLE